MPKPENPWAASMKPNPENSENYLLTLQDAARLLKCCKRTVERLVAAREIPVIRVGRAPRIVRTALLDWIENGGGAARDKEAGHGKSGF